MESKTEQINETEVVAETTVFSKTVPIRVKKGDCTICPYKTNTTSGTCLIYDIYGWCNQTMGSMTSSTVRYVDSTPDSSYPIRILRAYLDYTVTETSPDSELGKLMTNIQSDRNRILEKAIEILGRHTEELRAVIEEPSYRSIPDFSMLEELSRISEKLEVIEKYIKNSPQKL